MTKPFCYKTVREPLVFSSYPHALQPSPRDDTGERTHARGREGTPSARPALVPITGFDFAQFAVLSGAASWMIVREPGNGLRLAWAKVPRLLYRFVDGELVWGR